MSFRGALRSAFHNVRLRPEVILLGCGITVLQLALTVGFLLLLTVSAPSVSSIRGVSTVVSFLAFTLTLPAMVGIYELVLAPNPEESRTQSLIRAVTTTISAYPRVLRTDVAAVTVAGLVGVGGMITWYIVSTGARVVRYTVSSPKSPHTLEPLVFLIGAAFLTGTIGGFFVRFADVRAMKTTVSPLTAVTQSMIAARRHLYALTGFAVVVVILQVVPVAVLIGLSTGIADGSVSAAHGAWVVLTIAVNGVTVALTSAVHAVFYTDYIEPECSTISASPRTLIPSWSVPRVAVAVVLVIALVSGAVVVRTADPGVHPSPDGVPTEQALESGDADRVVEAVTRNTGLQNHRQVLYQRNASKANESFRVFMRSGVDYHDRQAYTYFRKDDGEEFGGFFGEGTLAMYRSGGRVSGIAGYSSGEWMVMPVPAPVRSREAGLHSVVPQGPTTGWETVHSSESVLAVRVTNANAIDTALGSQGLAGMNPPLANESHVTVYIDREQATIDFVEMHLHSLETGRNMQYRIEYNDVGTADLQRPEPIRDPSAIEQFWDAVYY